MALSRNYYKLCLSFAVAAVFFFSLTLLPPKSGGIQTSHDNEQLRKMVLGSRPPACVNKCKSCKPCEATLVIPPHQSSRIENANYQQLSSHREDDSYYLLSWKCRCGNKLYQP
ncbi:UNVERIFIED_CONTAM: EPIDERMAL PATTERNING FACTOR-like protein 2 [Sesamum angustifolium]|uniref:Epidermal patterning factor-like protein n=1 Tax=Sesamum angustifolium TaxID=2727405 RepID=A0AAW2LJ04_9LAMI